MHQRLTIVLLCIVISGCGRKGPPIDALVKAIDSAEIAVWQPVEPKADTLHHSLFYDSVLHYAAIAVQVESEKRRYAQAIIDLAPLLPQNLESWNRRKFSMDSLLHYPTHANLWETSLISFLRNILTLCIERWIHCIIGIHRNTLQLFPIYSAAVFLNQAGDPGLIRLNRPSLCTQLASFVLSMPTRLRFQSTPFFDFPPQSLPHNINCLAARSIR